MIGAKRLAHPGFVSSVANCCKRLSSGGDPREIATQSNTQPEYSTRKLFGYGSTSSLGGARSTRAQLRLLGRGRQGFARRQRPPTPP